MCDSAPVAHQAWGNSYLVTHIGDRNHCFVKVASAVEDPCHWHATAREGWSQPGFDLLPVRVLE